MDTTPLRAFASKAKANHRLLYGDLRRLQRDVLPAGPRTREDLEILLALDGIERVDEGWPGYLARAVTGFVLSTSDPPGVVDAEAAAWLAGALSDAKPKTAAAVVHTLMGEAHQVDEVLPAFVRRRARRPPISAAVARHPSGLNYGEDGCAI